MNRRERLLAEKEGRKPRKLHDSETAVPPWTSLRTLEEASRNFENDENGITEKWLNQLIRPGSSLGGARPKATVADARGQLWIAKFPSKNDESDTGAWEKTVHDLAGMCGLNVPESKLEKFSKLGSTFLVRRFDRDGKKRIHFASAMTLLGKTDGATAADGTSYLDIAAFIKANGANPKADLLELWKRIVFNMLVDEEDNRISIDLAIRTAYRFGISEEEAKKIAESMCFIVGENWEQLAKKYGLSRGQIEYMRPAFGECQCGQ